MLSGNGSVGNISIDFEMLISCNFNSLRDSSIYRWNEMKCFNSDWKWFKLQFQFIYCTHAISFILEKKKAKRMQHETWKQTNRTSQSLRLANCCHFIPSHHKLLCGRRRRREGRKISRMWQLIIICVEMGKFLIKKVISRLADFTSLTQMLNGLN